MTKLLLLFLISCSQVKIAETPQVIPAKPGDVFVTSHQPYQESINCSNKLIHLDEFKSRILAASYEQTNDNSFEVLSKIEQAPMTQVKPIWPRNPYSAMTATTFKNDPAIYLNARKSRQIPAMVGSVCHELMHLAGYSHRGNSPKGNERSVPYMIGAICEDLAPVLLF